MLLGEFENRIIGRNLSIIGQSLIVVTRITVTVTSMCTI